MRVELALIVGILFFCCWCAYIIVKMNSSVSTNHTNNDHNKNHHHLQPLASDATFTRLNNGSDISSYLYSHNQQPNTNQAPMLSVMGRNQQMQLRHQNSLPQASYIRQESIHQPTATAGSGRYYAQPSTSNVILHHHNHNPIQPIQPIQPLSPLQQPKPPYSALTDTWTAPRVAQANVNRYNHQTSSPQNNDWRNQYYPNNNIIAQNNNNWRPQVTAQSYFGRPPNINNNYASRQIPANLYHQPNPWRPATRKSSSNMYSKPRSSTDYPESTNLAGDQQATANDSDVDPDPDTEVSKTATITTNDGEEEQQAPSNEQGASAGEEEQQSPELNNREIEERKGERSFSEDESDANERDRDGNVLVTHHKHLINGKPVKSKRDDTDRAKKKAEQRSKNADFEKIANEIEEENSSTPDYDDSSSVQQETGESRERRKIIEPSGLGLVNLDRPLIGPNKTIKSGFNFKQKQSNNVRPINRSNILASDGGFRQVRKSSPQKGRIVNKRAKQAGSGDEADQADPLPKKGRGSHEHKLKESLTAQQWDDDASSPESNKLSRENEKHPREDGEQLESSSSTDGSDITPKTSSDDNRNEQDVDTKEEMEAEGETGPQQVEAEFKDLDLIADPEKFMHSDRRRRRRKRQVDIKIDNVNRENTDRLAISNISRMNDQKTKILSNQVEFDDTDTANLNNVTKTHDANDTNRKQDKSKDDEIVSSLENINHEMAANPPMIDENRSSEEQQANQAVAIDILPPPINVNNQIEARPPEGADRYTTFYENQREPTAEYANYPSKLPYRAPSPDTSLIFYQNGHSSGPYDIPPPQYYQDNQDNDRPNEEVQQQQQQQQSDHPQHPNDMEQFQLTQLQPPNAAPLTQGPSTQELLGSQNQPVDNLIDQVVDTNSPQFSQDKPSNAIDYNPLASGSKSKSKKVKKKFKKSKLAESKRKAALAHALKKKSKSKKGRYYRHLIMVN